jgi:hypothetical protein
MIGNNSTMIGSAIFTNSGITRRMEMAVHFKDAKSVREITKWFDDLWASSAEIQLPRLDLLMKALPPPSTGKLRAALTRDGTTRDAPLVPLTQGPDVRHYCRASGYYTGNGGGFCVIKGSFARSRAIPAFRYTRLRNQLIRTGVLSRSNDYGDYVFTEDHVFTSPTAAACIVSGQSRSGPKDWGVK